MTFRKVPAGSFEMGNEAQDDTVPVHRVEMSAFWMSACEVTNAQFERFKKRKRGERSPGDDEPVGGVTREEALAFARWLSKKEGRKYDLPSEAQWEYAARGGLEGKDYPWGDESPEGRALVGGVRCVPVGSYKPNAYGLYDMAGNVGEYVRESDYNYEDVLNQKRDPVGPTSGKMYLSRGAGVNVFENRVWQRTIEVPDIPLSGTGFRLILVDDRKSPVPLPASSN